MIQKCKKCTVSFFDNNKLKQQIDKNTLIINIEKYDMKIDFSFVKSIIINISKKIEDLTNDEKINIIKKIKKIKKLCDKRKINFGTDINGHTIILNIENADNQVNIKESEIIIAINAILYKNKKRRYVYLYKQICLYLDKKFKENNYCDFKNDICMAKKYTTMGCCHYSRHKYLGMFLPNDFVLCKYQQNRTCTANCITCKLFTCDELRKKQVKFNCRNVILINVFFNPLQKLIIKSSYFTKEKDIIKRLLLLDCRR